MKTLIRTALAAATIILCAGTASAHDMKLGDLVLSGQWVRATAPSAPTSAGYLTIRNTGSSADRLVSASTDIAGRTEIHTMTMDGGVMRMRQLEDGVEIPAGGEVALKPGGDHIMLMGLKSRIGDGETVGISLVFEKAGTIDLTFPASMKPGGKGHEGHKMNMKKATQ
jgi:hypothetical protein